MKKHLMGMFVMVSAAIAVCVTLGYCKPSATPTSSGKDKSHSASPTSDSVAMPPTYKPSQMSMPTTKVATPAAAEAKSVMPPAEKKDVKEPEKTLPDKTNTGYKTGVPTNNTKPEFIDNSLKVEEEE
jgi:hypothetical protein